MRDNGGQRRTTDKKNGQWWTMVDNGQEEGGQQQTVQNVFFNIFIFRLLLSFEKKKNCMALVLLFHFCTIRNAYLLK